MAEYNVKSTETTQKVSNSAAKISTKIPLVISSDGINAKKISAIFFDLDNTLIPTRSGDSKTQKHLADALENQFAFSKEESSTATQLFLKSFRRCPDNSQTSLDSWRTYLWREALPSRNKHLAEQIYSKWLKLRYRYLALPPEYINMLKCFREAGFLLALITNGPSNAQWEKIKKLNLSQYFDCILVSSDCIWEKPNPNIFLAAAQYLRVKPVECAMIGDKLETDIKGGHLSNLGLTFWLPLNANEKVDLLDVTHPPDIILKNLLDLCKYFPSLNVILSKSSSGSNSNAIKATERRGSQISCNATSSTCNYQYQQPYQQLFHQLRNNQKQHNKQQGYNKYRRGGSLPAIECFNSETENSSDSIIS